MLLSEEQHRSVFSEFLVPIKSADRAVSLRHVHAGRFVILFPWDTGQVVQPERDESRGDASFRMVLIQFVRPNRIELIQLIVQCVAAIFCYHDRVSVIHENNDLRIGRGHTTYRFVEDSRVVRGSI